MGRGEKLSLRFEMDPRAALGLAEYLGGLSRGVSAAFTAIYGNLRPFTAFRVMVREV